VETETFTLAAWESDPGIRYLSLAELSAFPVFQTPIHNGIHPFVDEFQRALVGVVDAEQQFRKIPPEQWNQHAWRGFYKLVATSFGGKLFLKLRRTRKSGHGRAKLSYGGGVRERDRRSWIEDQG
jgi:hypothetical protein